MAIKDDDFQKKLLATFKIEAKEHVSVMSSGLIELEKEPAAEKQMEIIETVFREAHSLKGAARAVNMAKIEAICQSVETIFAALKRKDIALFPEMFDVLHEAVDAMGRLLSSTQGEPTASEKSVIKDLVQKLESTWKGVPLPPRQKELKRAEGEETVIGLTAEAYPSFVVEKPVLTDTIRISTEKLDSLLLQTEELLSAKLTVSQRAADLRESNAALAAWEKNWAKICPDVRAIQHSFEKNDEMNSKRNGQGKKNAQMVKLLEFIEWNSAFVNALKSKLARLAESTEHDHRSLSGMVDNLLENMKEVLMLPFSSLSEIFPKFVRDLSHDQGKDVELVIHGADIEIDRRILNEMKDPLIHLVRNCIDHGIEKPEERERKRKLPRGTVTIAIAHRNNSEVEILISDNGAGVDIEKVRSAAWKLGIVSPEETERLSEQEVLSLIFQSGVSTSSIVSDISGRGLGLAIVREKVEKLGGITSFETRPDAGMTLRIVLPLTLATFRGVLVRVDEHLFVIPTINVDQVARVNKEGIKTVENRQTIQLNGQAVSLVRLIDVLQLPQKNTVKMSEDRVYAVVLGSAEKRIAFLVDEVLNEQEVLVKSLGKQLSRVRNIAGATVLSSGKVVPILNVPDLMKSAVSANAAVAKPVDVSSMREEVKGKSILVAEDSITARMLLKNILESAGYDVKTAIDGVDAFTALKIEDFDLVVSDVDMPRMSGFDLTAKIRADNILSELPVVLVTALESREDRERGIDVGANAYIVKSSFDQSNLLGVIGRLI